MGIQYGMHWASHWERKMNRQALKKPKTKKTKKTDQKDESDKEDDEELGPKPSVYDTLPFQVYELCKQAPTLPSYCQELYKDYRQRKEEERNKQEEVEEKKKLYEQR